MDDAREAVEDLLWQFAYRTKKDGRLAMTTGGLSALECGFEVMGWDDPHLTPEIECERDACFDEATCGTPTPDGYKRLCGKHYREVQSL